MLLYTTADGGAVRFRHHIRFLTNKEFNHEAVKVIHSGHPVGVKTRINCLMQGAEECCSLFHPACSSVRRRQLFNVLHVRQ